MRRTMIVDDEPLIRRELRSALEHAGYTVFEAGNGRDALRVFGETQPSTIVTDVLMPEADGIELIRAVKRINPAIRIIAMSSGGDMGFKCYLDFAKTLGADAIHPKPIDVKLILADLERFS